MMSFSEFKKSFAYGSRNNLSFKFLANFSDDEAANFIENLMKLVASSLNEDNYNEIIKHIVNGQAKAYQGDAKFTYAQGPFCKMREDLSVSKIGLLTSTGHFVSGDDPNPFDVKEFTQNDAVARISDFLREKPSLSIIPKETRKQDLSVRHGGYDITGAKLDPNVAFPIDVLKSLEKQGYIKLLCNELYSFVGACAQKALINEVNKNWLPKIVKHDLDGIVLVPA